jgi:DNA-binding NarL/FixJ family response regulator
VFRSFSTGVGHMTTVLVADDFPLVRDGFAAALSRDPAIRVVGFAEDGIDALEKTRVLHPEVVLLDLRMPRMSGLMALTQLVSEMPEVRVLVVSDHAADASVVDAVAAGASGFVSKHITGTDLCAAVHAVKRGEAALSPDLLGYLMRGLRRDGNGMRGLNGSPTSSLTHSELNVLRLVADGRTDKQISATLYISPRTVQSHLAHIRAKTGISRRTQLACWATAHAVT